MRVGLLALAGLVSACAGFYVGSAEGCEAGCAAAHSCGFLPSGLGYGVDSATAIADCERRCGKSPRDQADIATILSCLDGTWARKEVSAWCTDPEAGELAGDLGCATASACLAAEFPDGRLLGDVAVEVSLISLADFTMVFGEDALAGLYGASTAEPITSCVPALCGAEDCAAGMGGERPCDTTMCGRERVKTGMTCGDLGAVAIELGVIGRDGPPSTQVLLDDDAVDGAKECKEASRLFPAEDYELRPGPARAFARVNGRLPASELLRIGVSAVDDEDGAAVYCLAFPGMTATLRAGQNVLLVPIGTIDELAAAQLFPPGCGPELP